MAGSPDDNKWPMLPWYPRDHRADELVMALTLEEEGAHRRLLDHQWLHGSVPTDPKLLAGILRVPPAKAKRLWGTLAALYPLEAEGGRRQNRKLERVRQDREAYREAQRQRGSAGAASRWRGHAPANGEPMAAPSSGHDEGDGGGMAAPSSGHHSSNGETMASNGRGSGSGKDTTPPPPPPARVIARLDQRESEALGRIRGGLEGEGLLAFHGYLDQLPADRVGS